MILSRLTWGWLLIDLRLTVDWPQVDLWLTRCRTLIDLRFPKNEPRLAFDFIEVNLNWTKTDRLMTQVNILLTRPRLTFDWPLIDPSLTIDWLILPGSAVWDEPCNLFSFICCIVSFLLNTFHITVIVLPSFIRCNNCTIRPNTNIKYI